MSEHDLRDVLVQFGNTTVVGRAAGFLTVPGYGPKWADGYFEMPPEEVVRLSLGCGYRVMVTDELRNRKYAAVVSQVSVAFRDGVPVRDGTLRLHFKSDGAPEPLKSSPVAEGELVADLLRRVEALEAEAAPARDGRPDPIGAVPPPAMPPGEQTPIRCIVIAEGDYEESHEFATRAEYDAFSRGVDAGAEIYGAGSWHVVTIEDLGKYGKRVDRLIREHLGGPSE